MSWAFLQRNSTARWGVSKKFSPLISRVLCGSTDISTIPNKPTRPWWIYSVSTQPISQVAEPLGLRPKFVSRPRSTSSCQIWHNDYLWLHFILFFIISIYFWSLVTYCCFIRPPGTLVPKAFCFSRDVYFFLIRHRISELPRPIATKLYHVITIYSD